mgnify:CR=1 FL=1
MVDGSWFFSTSPTSSLPNTAPLPSSPRINPRGVHDALRDVGRVYHRPLCACPAGCKQAQADNKCHSCSHVTLDFSGFHYLLSACRMVRFRVHTHVVPVRREGQDVRRLVV